MMIARGAEANPSCFRDAGLLDPSTDVMVRLTRVVRWAFNLPKAETLPNVPPDFRVYRRMSQETFSQTQSTFWVQWIHRVRHHLLRKPPERY